jgi:large subunit ribosomal protein L7/L12
MEITHEQLIDHLSKMSVMDIVSLTKELEKTWGVSAAPIAVAAVGGAGPAAAAAPVEEQTEFTVELTTFGEKKIQVIKVVREITGLGLKEAKDLVEAAPKPVKEGISKADAEEIKRKIEAEGGTATIK